MDPVLLERMLMHVLQEHDKADGLLEISQMAAEKATR